jgi:Nif-specific regulatory protein
VTQESPKSGLIAVGSLLERGVDLDTILAAIVDEVVGRLGADRGTLYLLDRDRNQIFSKAAHLPEIEEIRLELGQGVAGSVAVSGKLTNLPDPYADGRFEKKVDKKTGYTTDSMLVAPIRDSEGDILGVLQVLNKKEGRFGGDDEETVTALAQQAGQVIEKTSLYAALKPRRTDAPPRKVDYRYNRIVGSSKPMLEVYKLVDKAAATNATVLLMGESGTGKGLIARAIHVNSERRDKPFVKVDCASLPASLIENELFGHEKGAFTGADKATPGKFELAEGGTVFIDEIGELPLALQSKLLRVIQEREFERVGGTRTIQVDFRLVAATNRDLEAMVADGGFRADLYYRIRVVPIVLPPLRDRGEEDTTRLAEHFLEVFAKKHKRRVHGFSSAAMSALLAHSWPGNIRELENCVESAVVLSDDELISKRHLSLPSGEPTNPSIVTASDLSRTLEQVERDYILAVLDDCGGNQSEAARRLGISRNTLGRKLKSYE